MDEAHDWSILCLIKKQKDIDKVDFSQASCAFHLLENRALVHGAVISAFLSVAQAMTDQGCV